MSRRAGGVFDRGGHDEVPPPRFAETLLAAPLPLKAVQRSALRRLLDGAPEAVTVAGKGIRTARALRQQLGYIGRHGDLPLWDEAGLKRQGRADVADLARDWLEVDRLDSLRRAGGVFARSLTLTAPPGSDPLAVRLAVADHLRTNYEPFDHVYAFHTDRPHPHAHVIFRTLGRDGRRLLWNPEELQLDRARFARALRDHGVESQATLRRLRQLPGKTPPRRLWWAAHRLADQEPDAVNLRRAQVFEANAMALAEPDFLAPREGRVAQAHRRTTAELGALAARLAQSPAVEDRDLGAALERHLHELEKRPAPTTERAALAEKLRAAKQTPGPTHEPKAHRRSGALDAHDRAQER